MREFGPYIDVLIEKLAEGLKDEGYDVETYCEEGDALNELRLRVSEKPALRKIVQDGKELTFYREDLVGATDLVTGEPVPWLGTVHHDSLAEAGQQ